MTSFTDRRQAENSEGYNFLTCRLDFQKMLECELRSFCTLR